MNESPPAARRTRPAYACLDGEEMRTAAMGQPVHASIRKHLSGCEDCARAVRDLRQELGLGQGRSEMRRYGSSLLARPAFRLVLLVLALLAVAVVVIVRQPAKPKRDTSEPAAGSAESAVPAPVRRNRARSRRPAGQSIDAEIVATVRRNQGGVRTCYERALKRQQTLTLRLDVQVSVRSSGIVDQVSIDGPAADPELTACIRNVIKMWQFPRAPDAYRSAFPLRLQPGQ